jgi:glycine betaine catabolism B
MIKIVDDFLNRITMYRLILYYLIVIVAIAAVFSFYHILSYDPVNLILSALFLVFFSGFINDLFAKVFKAPVNIESFYITALILALIITPAKSLGDFTFLAWVAILSMASKYILAINHKHIFNPAAIAVSLTALFINQSASWWVGNLALMPFVVIGGLLIVRKIRREDMIFSFILTAVLVSTIFTLVNGGNLFTMFNTLAFHSSLFFFAFVMLTEPLTTPPTKNLQMLYAGLVGFLFVPNVHLASLYSTPELALVAGNVFSYLVSPKEKLILFLKEKIKLSPDTYDFVFPLKRKLAFRPGQYMEWTLEHDKPDDRGNRRYFTLASSPTEDALRLGVKFYEPSSSFKKALLSIDNDKMIIASQRAGDFTLPADPKKKLVFLAGGIGVTPFRSILKYLIDKHESRDIVVVYSNKYQSEIVYTDVLTEAEKKLKAKIIYTLTDKNHIPHDWQGKTGRVDEELIKKEIPDYLDRHFYLSGPHAMVTAFETVLKKMSVSPEKIKTDFFPGFV